MRAGLLFAMALFAVSAPGQEPAKKPATQKPAKQKGAATPPKAHTRATPEQVRRFNELQEKQRSGQR